MKKIAKIAVSCFALAFLVLLGANTANAADVATKSVADSEYDTVKGLTQTGATTNTVSLSWTPTEGASGYVVVAYVNGQYVDLSTSVVTTNYTTVSVPANSKYDVFVVCNLNTGANYKYSDGIEVKTVPTATKMTYSGVYCYVDSIYYQWAKVNCADGYEIQYKGAGQSTKTKTATAYSTSINYSKFVGRFQQARVRAYTVINGQKYYAPWSNYVYTGVPNASKSGAKYYRGSKKIVMKWTKVTGAYHYKVYISKKDNKHYKKAATLSSKARSYTFKKCGSARLKSNTKYYVKLVVTSKIGGKEKTSNYYYSYYQTL